MVFIYRYNSSTVLKKGEPVMTLKEAEKRIKELEQENAELKSQIKILEARSVGGRKKHDAKWMASYNAFAALYEKGMNMTDIVERSSCSRRTCYRYKAYYEELHGKKQK